MIIPNERLKHATDQKITFANAFAIADEVLRLVAEEEGKAEPDPVVFHNGCLLLYDLHCEAEVSQYADRYGTLIEQAYGLDEKGLADMKKTLSAGP